MDTNTINHVSLCSGYGGIDLGLKRAIGERLRTVAFVEVECFAVCNLAAKTEAKLLDNAPIWSDLRTFPWGKFHGLVDILSGGYPCQPFSAAGKRLGAEDPRHLWPHISAGIALMRPSVCFFENVEGHISLGLPDVLQDLAGMGYRTTWCVASASECGAPHQRKRIFILAHDQRQRIEEFGRQIAGASQFDSAWNDGGHLAWPSRPGEQQFAWEPPRVVVDAKSQRAGQRSELRSEECGSRGALPWDVEQSGEGDAMDDAARMRSAEPTDGLRQAAPRFDASSDQAMGNAQRLRPQGRDNTGCVQEVGASRAELAGDGCGELGNAMQSRPSSEWPSGRQQDGLGQPSGAMGHANSPRPQVRPRQRGSAIQGADADGGETAGGEIKSELGLLLDGSSSGLGGPNVSGLSDQELAEIRQWMATSTNRTDSLRLLGNGVVPATAERAFRVLVGELMDEQR